MKAAATYIVVNDRSFTVVLVCPSMTEWQLLITSLAQKGGYVALFQGPRRSLN